MTPAATAAVLAVCVEHLGEEERMLRAALPIVRSVQSVVTRGDPAMVADLVQQHAELTGLVEVLQRRRQALRHELAQRLAIPAAEIRLVRVVQMIPGDVGQDVLLRLTRIRGMADELVTTNHRLSLHLRIYLDTYQRLLRDLTGTGNGSGRYGPQGKPELPDYRPLIHIHG